MKLMRVGVDLAKAVFQVHGVDRDEKVTLRRKLTRASWLEVLLDAVEPGCVIGMELVVARTTGREHCRRANCGEVDCTAVCEAVCEEQQE